MHHARPQVLLIHGTFAPRAAWTRAESLLCGAIQRHVPGATIEAIDWGGGNSPGARFAAATVVEERVRRANAERAPVFVVAHSHGGNAALYAARNLEAAGEASALHGIACLATPFIQAKPRQVPESDLDTASDIATAILWTPMLMYCAVKVAGFGIPILEPSERMLAMAWRDAMVGVLVVLAFLRILLHLGIPIALERLRTVGREWGERLQTPALTSVPVLVVRTATGGGTVDEAIIALRWSRRLINAMFALWGVLAARRRPRLSCSCLPGCMTLFVATAALAVSPNVPDLIVAQLFSALLLLLITSFVTLAAIAGAFFAAIIGGMFVLAFLGLLFASFVLRRVSWGSRGEGLAAPLIIDLVPLPVPVHDVDEVVLPRRGLLSHWLRHRDLVHSIYTDPDAAEAVGEWIARRVQGASLK